MSQVAVAMPGSAVFIKAGQTISFYVTKNPTEKDRYKALVDFDLVKEAAIAGVDLYAELSPRDYARVMLVIAGHLVSKGLAEVICKNKQIH